MKSSTSEKIKVKMQTKWSTDPEAFRPNLNAYSVPVPLINFFQLTEPDQEFTFTAHRPYASTIVKQLFHSITGKNDPTHALAIEHGMNMNLVNIDECTNKQIVFNDGLILFAQIGENNAGRINAIQILLKHKVDFEIADGLKNQDPL